MKDSFFEQYPYLCDTFFIKKNIRIEEKEVAAEELISPYRLDIMAKLLWIDASEGKFDKTDADKLYEAHLWAFSNGMMIEPGQSEKRGLDSYCTTFSGICSKVRETQNELVEIGNPIPVDGKYMAMDGAHRISAAIYYKRRLPIYRVYKVIPNKYDYRFFQRRYLAEEYILMMVEKYVLMRNCRLYIIEKSKISRDLRKQIYREYAPVYMKKVSSGELLLLIDCDWMKTCGKSDSLYKCLGDCYVEGKNEISRELAAWKAKLLIHERGYACKKRLGILRGMCWNRFKICVKRLMGRPI